VISYIFSWGHGRSLVTSNHVNLVFVRYFDDIYVVFRVILHHFMKPNRASYKVIQPGLIGTTKKLSYSQTGNCNHMIWKWDNFFIPTPMRFIHIPGDSSPIYQTKSSFLQSDSSWFDWNDEEAVLFPNWETGITWFESGITSSPQLRWDLFNFLVILQYFMYQNHASYIAIHPGLIRMTKELSYSQTGKLGSPDLKVGYLLHPNSYEI